MKRTEEKALNWVRSGEGRGGRSIWSCQSSKRDLENEREDKIYRDIHTYVDSEDLPVWLKKENQ